jgi:peptide/nickel transport system permease protein
MNAIAEHTEHQVSPGLWALAWRRLKADRVAMASMAIVGAYFLLLIASATGLAASDWDAEVAVNYAPPTFIGPQSAEERLADSGSAAKSEPVPENPLDPLKNILRELRGNTAGAAGGLTAPEAQLDMYGVKDPLEQEMKEVRAELAKKQGAAAAQKAETLPFGADKWGHDVIKKTIKGGETSIVVGLVAAVLATLLGTVFGALSGYYGRWVDDFFNWFYSIFTSVP